MQGNRHAVPEHGFYYPFAVIVKGDGSCEVMNLKTGEVVGLAVDLDHAYRVAREAADEQNAIVQHCGQDAQA